MGFRPGAYAKVWKVDDRNTFAIVSMSISNKNKETEQYETSWQEKCVLFVKGAYDKIKNIEIPKNGYTIKINTSFDITNHYDHEAKKLVTDYKFYSFDVVDSEQTPVVKKEPEKAVVDDDEFPF